VGPSRPARSPPGRRCGRAARTGRGRVRRHPFARGICPRARGGRVAPALLRERAGGGLVAAPPRGCAHADSVRSGRRADRRSPGRRRAVTPRLPGCADPCGRLAGLAGGRAARRVRPLRRVPQTVTGMRDRIRILVRVGLGALLVWAAVAKLRDPHAFAQDIANYRILPASLVAPVAATLPGVEIVVGLALVLAAWRRAAAAAAFWLLV